MIVFDDGEFEISLVTFCRPEFISHILNTTYHEASVRNIRFKIRDSSPDGLTEKAVKEFNERNHANVECYKVDSGVNIGYKPVLGIQEAESRYVWTACDSFYFDYQELDDKVFPYIKDKVDFIVLYNWSSIREGIYTDKTESIHELFIPVTCIGTTIFKTDIFSYYREDPAGHQRVEKLYGSCYGFAYLAYYLDAFARSPGYRASYSFLNTISVEKAIGKKKVQAWAKRFYECWVFELIYMLDSLPDCYKDKEKILEETWEKMKLDSWDYCYRASRGDLDRETFERIFRGGTLRRITKKPERIRFFACAPDWCVEIAYRIRKYAIVYPVVLIRKLLGFLKSG